MTEVLQLDQQKSKEVLLQDFAASGIKGAAKFLPDYQKSSLNRKGEHSLRQKRHCQ